MPDFSTSGAMPRSLAEWLARLERLHPTTIDMGLDRVAAVCGRMGLVQQCPVILVGGTNGKGSTCAMLEAIYRSAGYDTGLYTSPHLLRYNERVRVNRKQVSDDDLIRAFEHVEAARDEISLTYFEFGTLAAQWIFCQRAVEVAILEVGLGGRLDATNIFEPTCSVVTSIDIDHVEYLGHDRESIGREKAGIFRGGRPAICADDDAPRSVLEHARTIGADLYLRGRDFGYLRTATDWQFWSTAGKKSGLPLPGMAGEYQLDNAAAVLACVETMHRQLPVGMNAIRTGLLDAAIPGRFQVLAGLPPVILDVAHNPAAARALAEELRRAPASGKTFAVFAVLGDKDIEGIVSALANEVSQWFICGLPAARAASPEQVERVLTRVAGHRPFSTCATVSAGLAAARGAAGENDRILVFGSFYTVSEALKTSEALVAKAGLQSDSRR